MSANLENLTPEEILLEDYMKPMGLTQNALARGLGVPPRRVNEIIHGIRATTPLRRCTRKRLNASCKNDYSKALIFKNS